MTPAQIGTLAIGAAFLALGMLPSAGRWMPRVGPHPDALALRDAGWPHGIARWEGSRAAVAVAGPLLGSALGTGLGISLLAGLTLALLPSVLVRVRAQAARDRARASLAQLLLAAHALLRSGVALPEALRRAAMACADPLARRPFVIAIERFDLGESLDDAIRGAVATSSDRRLVATFQTLALGVTERLPIERAAALLEAMAERAVHDQRVDAEVRARTAGVRVQTHLLAAVVPGLALYLVATMPGLAATLGTPIGRTALIPGAALLELAGIVVSRRIVRGVSR